MNEGGMFGDRGGMNPTAGISEVSTAKNPMEAMREMAKRQELLGGIAQIAQAIVHLEDENTRLRERLEKVEKDKEKE